MGSTLYVCMNTAFHVADLKNLHNAVKGAVNYYIKSKSGLTAYKFIWRNKRHWSKLQKAAFIYYCKNHPNYTNPLYDNFAAK